MSEYFTKFLIIILLNLYIFPLTLFAQKEATEKYVPNMYNDFNSLRKDLGLNGNIKGNDCYLKQYNGYRNNEKLFLDKHTELVYYDILSSYLTFLGSFHEALICREKNGVDSVKYSEKDSLYVMDLKVSDAYESICKMADSVKIVMINEAHHIPQHRILSAKLLKALYDKGFRYFCTETINNSDTYGDDSLNIRKYPVMNTGFYSMEPLHGDLIRQALKIGFTVVPYEQVYGSKKDREVEQAENIYNIFQKDPDAKVFVHCGYAHITPNWMAGKFREMSGIRPLTIDQTSMMEYSLPIYSDKSSQIANNNFKFNKPIILTDNNGNSALKYNNLYDVVVFNPQTKYLNDRPDWMLMDGYRKAFNLNTYKLDNVFLVQAIRDDEDIDTAIPIDQILVENYKNPVLFLPSGKYILKFIDKDGNILLKKEISVPE